ncbi:MAG TPA: hypothetical protein VGH13_00550 [Xanthobacteraceae bacterium]
MSVKLCQRSFDYAKELIANRRGVLNDRADWSDHKTSRTAQKKAAEEHGYAEYGQRYLGEDDEQTKSNRSWIKCPYGDVKDVQRCAVLAAASPGAGQYKYADIEMATVYPHGVLDELRQSRPKFEAERSHASAG